MSKQRREKALETTQLALAVICGLDDENIGQLIQEDKNGSFMELEGLPLRLARSEPPSED